MRRYRESTGEVAERSERSRWRAATLTDRAAIGYGLLVVGLVAVSYVLGAVGWLPDDPSRMDMARLNAPPGAGHLLGTDFLGRDILSRLIVGIQAYFLPGLLAVAISLALGIAAAARKRSSPT